MSGILVISPHPDDDAIGCGGTLRQHVVQGDPVRVILLTSGEKGGHGRPPQETACVREAEAKAAGEILGISPIEFWREPDGAFRATRPLVNRLRRAVEAWQPDLIYVPHDLEMHPDHRAAARLVRRALCGPAAPAVKPTVMMFEVWTPLQQFDQVVDISPHIETKIAAVRAHRTQCDAMRFDEACLGLCRYRGEMHSWPGGDYAEVFAEMQWGLTRGPREAISL